MIDRDRDKRRRRRRLRLTGLALAVALLGGGLFALTRPSPQVAAKLNAPAGAPHVIAYPRADESPAAVVARIDRSRAAPSSTAQPVDPPAYFAALTAPDATPEMLSKAWAMTQRCEREQAVLSVGKQDPERCELPPGGKWQDPATVKRMLEARVTLNAYGAREDVAGHRSAFADDPQRWRTLVAQATADGLAHAEPSVVGSESQRLLAEGDYRQAGIYAVAHAVNTARLNAQIAAQLGATPPTPKPITADERVAAVWPKLNATERKQVEDAGQALAKNWKVVS